MTATQTMGISDVIGTLRRRLPYVAGIAPPILLLAIFLAYWLTPQYQATATVLLQPSSVTKDVIQSTVSSTTEEEILDVQNRVLTVGTLEDVVKAEDPYPQDRNASVLQKAQRLLAGISVENVDSVSFKPTTDASNAFSLHYVNPDRRRAAAVALTLSQLFVSYNQRQRVQTAQDATTFLKQQAAELSKSIAGVDGELAKLKITEGEALPELRDQNQGGVDLAEHNIDALQQQILAAEDKESRLSVQLAQMSPNLMAQSGDVTDVATVRAQLAEAEERYTPEHPEVKRLKRALQVLMAQNANRQPGVVASADNPQYVMTATELQSARRELASLRAQTTREQSKLANYQELLRRTPTVERTESEILRRRQSLQSEYQQILDKLQDAQEAQSFEVGQHGDKFILVHAPEVPKAPYSPNRPGYIALGLLLGLGLAGIAVAVAETMDRNIRTVGDLPHVDDGPLLATIPIISNGRDRLRRRAAVTAWGLAYGLAIIGVGIVIRLASHNQ